MPGHHETEYSALVRSCHPACIACRSRETGGLGLRFARRGDGSVGAIFVCDAVYQGYPDRLHGGVIATLLDAAMTHWLFSRGIQGVTAKLSIRYHEPILVNQAAQIRAWIVGERPPFHLLRAEICQAGTRRASAEGAFSSGGPLPVQVD